MTETWNIDQIIETVEKEYIDADLEDSWRNEREDVNKTLKLLKEEYEKEYIFKDCIAVAGSRIVIKVEDAETEDIFALKICRPFEEAIEPVKEEFENIQDLYHNNLIKIFSEQEFMVETDDSTEYEIPITVEEYIPDGKHLREWLEEELESITNDYAIIEILHDMQSMFIQIIDGLVYLHEHHVYHCDLKPQNILVKGDTPKIVDFGYSKKRLPRLDYSDTHSNSQVGFTWDYAWPPLRTHIERMESPEAAYAHEEEDFPFGKIDMYGLGRTLEECINIIQQKRKDIQIENSSDKQFHYIREAEYFENYLRLIAGRMKGTDANDDLDGKRGYITNYSTDVIRNIEYADHPFGLRQASDDLNRMDVEDLGTVAPEWDDNLPERVRIGKIDVPFTPRVRRLYNHPYLSKLSQVSQLGLVAYVYPGARHSRLEHMMGTFSRSCKYIESMWAQKEDPFFRCVMDYNQVTAASLGALLHDIGQYPHCHDIEDSLVTLESHESMSHDLYEKEIQSEDVSYPSLRSIIEEEWNEVVARLVKEFLGNYDNNDVSSRPRLSLLRGIIASSIDADKLDYVQRDSNNLGVEYGARIEEKRLIDSLRPIVKNENGTRSRVKMGLNRKGTLPAQSLIIAREQMYERAYWHKTVRSFKSMLKTALRRDSESEKIVSDIIDEFREIDANDWKSVDNILDAPTSYHLVESDQLFLQHLYKRLNDDGSKFLIKEILQRQPYQPLIDLNVKGRYGPTDRAEITNAIEPLQRALEPPNYNMSYIEDVRKELQQRLLNLGLIDQQDWVDSNVLDEVCIIIDIPARSAFGSSTVWISEEEPGDAKEINIQDHNEIENQTEEWRKSIVPRIYLHRAYEPDGIDTHTIANALNKSRRSIK